jgi:hypothetical protein
MQWKTECTVNGRWKGFAHIVEAKYDDEFTAIYGCVDVDLPDEAERGIIGNTLTIQVPDGRRMEVYVLRSICNELKISVDGNAPSKYYGCYFVSHGDLTTLEAVLEKFNNPDPPKGW